MTRGKRISEAKGLAEAREYANKMMGGNGSHQDYSDLTNVLLVGMVEEPEFDVVETRKAVAEYMRLVNNK